MDKRYTILVTDDDAPGILRGFGKRLLSTGKVAASASRLAARRLVRAEGEKDGELGELIARELDQMKGMAMKVGQILSYIEGALPEETHAALRKLQRGAKPIAFETMAAVIEKEFGAPVDELFDAFERAPIASASVGQVYRARFQGEPVAVKVQYPGVRETIAADMSRMSVFASLASAATSVDGAALIHELKTRVDEECDYENEARNQRFFRDAFAGDAQVIIPRVIEERSRTTVITTEWCDGADFYSNPDPAVGLILARFAFHSLFQLGALNADPHPGNYLFPPDGRVVFLDFGLVRRFDPEFLEAHRRLVRVVVNDDRASFRDALIATGIVAKERGFDFDLHWALLCHEYAPYRSERFKFTLDYVRTAMQFNKPSNPNLRRIAIPPQWIWVERLTWGLHAVLGRLGSEGPFREILLHEL